MFKQIAQELERTALTHSLHIDRFNKRLIWFKAGKNNKGDYFFHAIRNNQLLKASSHTLRGNPEYKPVVQTVINFESLVRLAYVIQKRTRTIMDAQPEFFDCVYTVDAYEDTPWNYLPTQPDTEIVGEPTESYGTDSTMPTYDDEPLEEFCGIAANQGYETCKSCPAFKTLCNDGIDNWDSDDGVFSYHRKYWFECNTEQLEILFKSHGFGKGEGTMGIIGMGWSPAKSYGASDYYTMENIYICPYPPENTPKPLTQELFNHMWEKYHDYIYEVIS
jgi:hypothetical protein